MNCHWVTVSHERVFADAGAGMGVGMRRLPHAGPVTVSVSVHVSIERDKGIRWMPWHREAMKDVARCEKRRGAASRL